jgi:Flp pilus assembly protein TadB
MITAAHFRVRKETGANVVLLSLAIVSAAIVLVTFVFTTLIHEPASIVALVVIVALGVMLDFGWKHRHSQGADQARLTGALPGTVVTKSGDERET